MKFSLPASPTTTQMKFGSSEDGSHKNCLTQYIKDKASTRVKTLFVLADTSNG